MCIMPHRGELGQYTHPTITDMFPRKVAYSGNSSQAHAQGYAQGYCGVESVPRETRENKKLVVGQWCIQDWSLGCGKQSAAVVGDGCALFPPYWIKLRTARM